jgi:nucleoid-associated protein YgaU
MRTEIKIAIAVGVFIIFGAIIWTASDFSREKQITELPGSLVSSERKAAEPAGSPAADARPGSFARPASASDAGRQAGAAPADTRGSQPPRTESGSRPLTVQPPPARELATGTPPAASPASASEAKDGAPASGGPLPPLAPPVAADRGEAAGATEPPRSSALDARSTGPAESPVATPATADRPVPRGEPGEVRTPGMQAPGSAARPGPAPAEPGVRSGAAQPPAGSAAETVYTVQEGDTLSAIARDTYGEDRFWTKIREANPGIDPHRLLVGQKLRLPSQEAVRAGRPASPAADAGKAADGAKRPDAGKPADGREPRDAAGAAAKSAAQEAGTYVVESGDTLIKIARKLFNDPNRWREIYDLNRDNLRSPDDVPAGMTLKVPPARKERPRERG